jgi:hypothetical protein
MGNDKETIQHSTQLNKNKDWFKDEPEAPHQAKNDIEINGNADAKILAKAFSEFSRDGLTLDERDQIKKISDVLKDANIIINNAGDRAVVAQENGKTFTIKSNGIGK